MDNLINSISLNMIAYFGNDVRRINHALKVYSFAKFIANKETSSYDSLFIVEAAALLHDIGIKISEQKYNSSSGKYQELEGPAAAAELLKNMNIQKKSLERILFLIGNHHSYNKIDDIDFQILVEADFLVNIFEDNLDRPKIENIKNKYFKSKTGLQLIESMYL
jgi:predicted HD phosphohydrolase